MNNFEVEEPILNTPYEEPALHWLIEEGRLPEKKQGRRQAGYFYRDPKAPVTSDEHEARGQWVPLERVNLIRERMRDWQQQNYTGATRITLELLNYWRREGRQQRLFFAQLEAVETIIFLHEALTDFLQGIAIPIDEISDDRMANGYNAFKRYACKMATGSGKTTVMVMLAAWSILNKVQNRNDGRFSDGEAPEVPRYETSRGPGSTAEVDFWTSKDVREIIYGHVNYVVADTKKWEQAAAYVIDNHEMVDAFVKNAGLGFAIPYLHNGQPHDYMPDFIIRLKCEPSIHLILETKGFDELAEIKAQAAKRWVDAVNAEGSYGTWEYAIARKPEDVGKRIEEAASERRQIIWKP